MKDKTLTPLLTVGLLFIFMHLLSSAPQAIFMYFVVVPGDFMYLVVVPGDILCLLRHRQCVCTLWRCMVTFFVLLLRQYLCTLWWCLVIFFVFCTIGNVYALCGGAWWHSLSSATGNTAEQGAGDIPRPGAGAPSGQPWAVGAPSWRQGATGSCTHKLQSAPWRSCLCTGPALHTAR